VIKGTPASTASDPEYITGDLNTDHALQTDMPLYRVRLNGINVEAVEPLHQLLGVLPEGMAAAQSTANAAQTKANAALPAASAASFLRVVSFDSATGTLTTAQGVE